MTSKFVSILGIVLICALASCGKAASPSPTADPTDPPIPTNTPKPIPTNTPAPTNTLAPTRTPGPPFDSATLDDLAYTESVKIVEALKKDISSGEKAGISTADSIIEYVQEPAYYHLYNKQSPYQATTGDPMAQFGIQEGDDLLIEMYDDAKTLVFSLGDLYEYMNKETDVGQTMGAMFDVASSMGLGYSGLDMTDGYEFLHWLGPLEFSEMKTLNDTPCRNYIFTQEDLQVDRLPEGMKVSEASGSVCVAETGNHLVHMDLKMDGENLYLKAPIMAQEPVVPAGSLEYAIDTNPFQGGEIPADVVNKGQPPQDVPVYEGSMPMMILTGLSGVDIWVYETDAATQDVIEYYKTEMVNQGWTLDSEEDTETGANLFFSKEDITSSVSIDQEAGLNNTTIAISNTSEMEKPLAVPEGWQNWTTQGATIYLPESWIAGNLPEEQDALVAEGAKLGRNTAIVQIIQTASIDDFARFFAFEPIILENVFTPHLAVYSGPFEPGKSAAAGVEEYASAHVLNCINGIDNTVSSTDVDMGEYPAKKVVCYKTDPYFQKQYYYEETYFIGVDHPDAPSDLWIIKFFTYYDDAQNRGTEFEQIVKSIVFEE